MITLLKMSLSAAVLITLILLLRAAFLNRLPKRTFKLLWAVAAARMLLPVFLPLLPALPLEQKTDAAAVYADEPIGDEALAAYERQDVPKTPHIGDEMLALIWAAGFLTSAAAAIIRHRRIGLICRTAPDCRSRLICDMADSFGLKRSIKIKISDEISSPLTCGVFSPTILLPEKMQSLDSGQLRHVLTHEIMHIRMHDVLYKYLLMTAACVHWFDPLAWVMLFMANRDIELACDEALLGSRGDIRREYALLLLGLEEQRMPLSAGFGSGSIKERIVTIMKFKKASAAAMIASVCLVIGSLTVFASTYNKTDDEMIGESLSSDTVEANEEAMREQLENEQAMREQQLMDEEKVHMMIVGEEIDGSMLTIGAEVDSGDIMTPDVPDVVGMDAEQARRVLEEAGYLPMIRERYYDADDVPAGMVGEVSPAPGTDLAQGSEVQYFVSAGPLVPREAE